MAEQEKVSLAERRAGSVEILLAEKRTQVFISIFGVLVSVIALGIWEKLASMEGVLGGLEHSSIVFEEYKKVHKEEASVQIARIDKNIELIRQLMTDSAARSDPFTGTQGGYLEHRIERLEKCCDRSNLQFRPVPLPPTR